MRDYKVSTENRFMDKWDFMNVLVERDYISFTLKSSKADLLEWNLKHDRWI